jgi:hypothetical protein
MKQTYIQNELLRLKVESKIQTYIQNELLRLKVESKTDLRPKFSRIACIVPVLEGQALLTFSP